MKKPSNYIPVRDHVHVDDVAQLRNRIADLERENVKLREELIRLRTVVCNEDATSISAVLGEEDPDGV